MKPGTSCLLTLVQRTGPAKALSAALLAPTNLAIADVIAGCGEGGLKLSSSTICASRHSGEQNALR